MLQKLNHYLSLIKFSHSIFALPFALIGLSLGILSYNEQETITQSIWVKNDFVFTSKIVVTKLLLVVACMIFARSAAMAFNRFLDRKYDALNPRTAIREIPAGIITPKNALNFTILCSIGFIVTCYFINTLCFYLSFVALAVVLGYSYTKRFTPLCHLVLGLGLSLAPIGAYLAVQENFEVLPILFSIIVLFWVSGFDIIYALQDEAFDRANKLKSIPVLLGTKNALLMARVLHTIAFCIIWIIALRYPFGSLYYLAAAIFSFLLFRQHSLVKANDLTKINLAFFTLNGIASIVFAGFVILDIFL